jgi:hypothetical protein
MCAGSVKTGTGADAGGGRRAGAETGGGPVTETAADRCRDARRAAPSRAARGRGYVQGVAPSRAGGGWAGQYVRYARQT